MTHIEMARRSMMAVAAAMKAKRAAEGISVRELEARTGVRHDILTRVERATWIPSPETAELIEAWLTDTETTP